MFVPLLVLRNAFRHKLRTTLTVVGIVVLLIPVLRRTWRDQREGLA